MSVSRRCRKDGEGALQNLVWQRGRGREWGLSENMEERWEGLLKKVYILLIR